jgi:hypothetical protein
MAGKKQQAPKSVEDEAEESEEGWDNAVDVDADAQDQAGLRMRDWRDVEKYREMRELRRLVGDEFDFTDVLGEIPIRTANSPRPMMKPVAAKGSAAKAAPAPAKGSKPGKPAPPPAPPKPAAKAPPPARAKAAPAKKVEHKPAPRPVAKKPAPKPPVRAKAKKK